MGRTRDDELTLYEDQAGAWRMLLPHARKEHTTTKQYADGRVVELAVVSMVRGEIYNVSRVDMRAAARAGDRQVMLDAIVDGGGSARYGTIESRTEIWLHPRSRLEPASALRRTPGREMRFRHSGHLGIERVYIRRNRLHVLMYAAPPRTFAAGAWTRAFDSFEFIEAAAPTLARNEQLERAILSSPDEAMPQQVYADWLIERDDPLGELMVLRLQGRERPERERAVLGAELAESVPEWGELQAAKQITLTWQQGLVRSVGVTRKQGRNDWPLDLGPVLAALLRTRPCLAVRELVIDLEGWNLSPTGLVTLLRETRRPPLLEHLGLASNVPLDLGPLREVFPHLRPGRRR